MKSPRLHAKFLVLVLGSLALFLGLLSVYLIQRETRLLERKEEEKQQQLASSIYEDLKKNMIQGVPRSTRQLMHSLEGSYGLVRIEVLREDGTAAFGSRRAGAAPAGLADVFSSGTLRSFTGSSGREHTILYPLKNEAICSSCHRDGGPVLGALLLSLSLDDSLLEIARSRRAMSLFFFAIILMVGAVLYVLVRMVVLRPLALLHQGAERIGRGDLSHRIVLPTGDEMQETAESLNLMAGRLEETYEQLEDRVRERTAEVRDKAQRLYEYSRDMATITRLSTRVFNAQQSLDELLDRFMLAIARGLRYDRSLLCLVDRKRAWIEVKRDSGLAASVGIADQPLYGEEPLARLIREDRELFIRDGDVKSAFPASSGSDGRGKPAGLLLVPIRSGAKGRHCWLARDCRQEDCPAYRREDLRCWLVPDTLCGNTMIESYGDKLSYCMTCEVFPVLGVLMVAAPPGQQPRPSKVNVLRILAAEMGAALENHRLHEDNRQLVRELVEMHTVTAAALAELSLERALQAFTDSALRFSGLDACNFWLAPENGSELRHAAGGGPGSDPETCPELLPLDRGVLGCCFTENRIVTDYNLHLREPSALSMLARSHGLSSVLAIPLRTERRTIGVFSVHKRAGIPFLDSEIAAFTLLANHAAMAINVCQLSNELKAQNRELAANISLMHGVLSNITSGIMLLDPEGRVKLINHAGAGLLQTAPGEILQRRLTEVLPEAGIFLNKEPGPYQEAEIRKRDGSVIPVGFSIALYSRDADARAGTIVVFRDLTEIKALEATVLNKERFAAMGQVVAGVAHEIRNPLFGISSIGQIFERELTNPAHLELTRALLSETRRLNHLVEDLLIYGRPVKLALADCDITAIWEEVIGMHRDEFAQKDVTLRPDFELGHTKACVDAHQIRQVFLNLMRNALDAANRGGTISIRLLLEDRYVIFDIADSGAGIPPEALGKVFDLFYTTKARGTGLGLAICKKIVEDHGGRIGIRSGPGNGPGGQPGTTVTVRLPYRAAAPQAAVASEQ